MPRSLVGRLAAAGYVLAVVVSTVAWVAQGGYSSALWLSLVLTLPLSPVAYVVVAIAAMFVAGSDPFVQTMVTSWLLLLLFPAMAISNVFFARVLLGERRPDQALDSLPPA